MLVSLAALSASSCLAAGLAADPNPEAILGHWKGIEIYQDRDSYDGRTFYLPNSEEIIVEKDRIRVYYYPYFKSDEFEAVLTSKSIVYTLDRKKVKSDYTFIGDTLVLSMHFINKNFIKMYERVQLDETILAELDQYGMNLSALPHEYELDTLRAEMRKGYVHADSLHFEPLRFIRFTGDFSVQVNKQPPTAFDPGYQTVHYILNGQPGEFRIRSLRGTQEFSIIPTSLCGCDSLVLPYIAVSWADRIRKQIAEDAG